MKVAINSLPVVAGEVAEATGGAADVLDTTGAAALEVDTTIGAAADEAGGEGKLVDSSFGGSAAEEAMPASDREVIGVAVGSIEIGSAAEDAEVRARTLECSVQGSWWG